MFTRKHRRSFIASLWTRETYWLTNMTTGETYRRPAKHRAS